MPELAAANARRAVLDPDAIAYIGEFESRASAVTIPILNAADLAQVSPSNTYVGLTTAEPGSTKGEPDKYYPTGRRTFVRLVPRDTIQGAALVSQLAGDGCSRPALVHDDESYGAGLSRILEEQGRAAGVTFVADLSAGSRPLELQSQARGLAKLGADCVVYTGLPGSVARGLLVAAAAALPAARLYGSDGLCQPGFTDPSIGGLPAAVGARFRCTLPTADLREIPGGAAFLDAFRARYGSADPDPYAVYGYEAMRLILDQISAGYTTRGSLTRSLLQVRGRRSVLGTYSVKRSGDTTLTDYGLYRVGSDGLPTFERTIHQAP
jgi:branched-chain amino acid transport system substrate-binding protein